MHGRVVIADDDPVIRTILRGLLVECGQHVLMAHDGWEALADAGRQRVDLILMDIEMPNLNGLEACRRLRLLPDTATTPIIMLTSRNDPACRTAAMALGIRRFITKPFQPGALLQAMAPYLALTNAAREQIDRFGRVNQRLSASSLPRPQAEPGKMIVWR